MTARTQPVALFLRGIVLPFRAGHFLLCHPRLWPHAALPLAINVLLAAALVAAFFLWAVPAFDVSEYIPGWLGETARAAVAWCVWLAAAALAALFLYFGFSAMGLVIASPFNDILSAKTETLLTGRDDPDLRWGPFLRETVRMFATSLWAAMRQLAVTLVFLPLWWVPVVGVVALLLVSGYFAGLGFLDIPMARHFFGRAHRQAGLTGRRAEVLGFGLGMLLLMLVPLGALVFLPLGVMGATLLHVDIPWAERFAARGVIPPPGFLRASD